MLSVHIPKFSLCFAHYRHLWSQMDEDSLGRDDADSYWESNPYNYMYGPGPAYWDTTNQTHLGVPPVGPSTSSRHYPGSRTAVDRESTTTEIHVSCRSLSQWSLINAHTVQHLQLLYFLYKLHTYPLVAFEGFMECLDVCPLVNLADSCMFLIFFAVQF